MKKPKKHKIYVHDDAGEITHVVYDAHQMDKYLDFILAKKVPKKMKPKRIIDNGPKGKV